MHRIFSERVTRDPGKGESRTHRILPEVLHVESRHIWWSPRWSIPPPFTPPSSLEPPSSTPQSFFAEGAIWNSTRKRVVVNPRGRWTHIFQTPTQNESYRPERSSVLSRESSQHTETHATVVDRINCINEPWIRLKLADLVRIDDPRGRYTAHAPPFGNQTINCQVPFGLRDSFYWASMSLRW